MMASKAMRAGPSAIQRARFSRGSRPQGSCFLDFLLRYLHAGQGVVFPSYSVRTFFLGTHRSYEGSPPDFKAPLSAL